MPNDRFFTPGHLEINQTIPLPEDESRHLSRVMRVQIGEEVEVVNGRGQLATAQVIELQKKHALLQIRTVHLEPPPPHEVIIAQALPRLQRLDTIVEKGTELGMTQLWLFPGQRSEKREVSDQQQLRIHAQMIAALKQSGRLYLPTLVLKPALNRWQDVPCTAFFGDMNDKAPPFSMDAEKVRQESVIFFVGPESGFAPEEERMLRRLKAKGVRLHPNILRTDTAPLVALSLISHWRM